MGARTMTFDRCIAIGFSALTVTLVTAAFLPSEAAARPKAKVYTYPPQVEEQCTDDYFRHCSPYALGSTELRRCMEAKGKDLSSNCRQALKDAGYVKSRRN
jgi:hypothetical protein